MPELEMNNTSPETADAGDALVAIQDAIESLLPLAEFHKAVGGATADDLRMHWDVRVLRGQDSPFAQVSGTSTLPRILARKRLALAPSAIQEEVSEKIAKPLLEAVLAELERAAGDGDGEASPDAGGAGRPS